MASCDPIFNTLVPIPKKNYDNSNLLTGVDWALQQKIYLDADNSPLQYGKKTYFSGETYSGSLEIKLDYQSSQLLPGLIKEVDIVNKSVGKIHISGVQNYPELSGIYDHVLDMNCKPYSTFWKHSRKNVILGKILIEENGDDKWEKCILKAWTGQSNTSQLEAGNGAIFTNHYWQGRTGANADGLIFDRFSLPDKLNFTDNVKISPQINKFNLKINSNRLLEVTSGNSPTTTLSRDTFYNFILGVENISAFQVQFSAIGIGNFGADISIFHDPGKIGQLHRFLKVGGIYYQDIDSIYGQRYKKLGAKSISNGAPIWNLVGKPSIEFREAFEIMWYGHPAETKFLPKQCANLSLDDTKHPKYQAKLFNYSNNFVKFDLNKLFGKKCPNGESSCSMSLNWASSSSLSRTQDTDPNLNNPSIPNTQNPSVYEPVAPRGGFRLPTETDILDDPINEGVFPSNPAPEGGCPAELPFPLCAPTNVEGSSSCTCTEPRMARRRMCGRRVPSEGNQLNPGRLVFRVSKSKNVINKILNRNSLI
jgi:hypothetical protein